MDRGDTDQPGEPSASRPGQYSSKEPTRSHVPQDRHHGFQHRCETLYLAQRRQPGVKFSPSPEAALLEHSSGGTPAALTHLLLLEYGGSKMILQAQERATRSKSGTPHTLDTGFPHRSAVRLGDGGGVTWVSAQDRRSAALKLPWETGPRQGQLCQQEGGNPSLPTFFPSASPTLNKDYFCRPCVQASRIWPTGSTADLRRADCQAMEKHTPKSNTLAQLCLA